MTKLLYDQEPVSPRTSAAVLKVDSPPQALGVVRAKTLTRARASDRQAQQSKVVLGTMMVFWIIVFWLFKIQGRQGAAHQAGKSIVSIKQGVVGMVVLIVSITHSFQPPLRHRVM